MKTTAIIAGLSVLAASAQAATNNARQEPFSSRDGPRQAPAEPPAVGKLTSQGCFSSLSSSMTKIDSIDLTSLSAGSCGRACEEEDALVMALGPKDCLCGKTMPPKADLEKDDDCNYACPAYALEACGSFQPERWSLWNLGEEVAVPVEGSKGGDDGDEGDEEDSSSTISSSSAAAASETGSVTEAPSSTVSSNRTTTRTTETGTQTTGSEDPEETDGTDEPGMGNSLVGSVAAVAAVAGGSMWLLL